MATKNVTELDFDQIKTDLRTYLQDQDRFKDYDFTGSNMNVLLDILSYNTFQNNFYTNMAFNEMFLDTAQLRDSLVSHTKELNYLPRSKTSAHAKVNVELSVGNSPSFVTIPAKTKFIARCGNVTYNFYSANSATITPVDNQYKYYGLDIYEGTYVTETFTADGTTSQRFVLSNENMDTDSIRVYVKTGAGGASETEYLLKTNIFGVTATDEVFYIQPAFGDKYEINFGQNVFGNQPDNGNIIRIEYRVTSGDEANGITSFTPAEKISGYTATSTLYTKSTGGADKETTESIRFNAPKSVQVQERAVTESDYAILLQNQYPEVQSVAVYGGEETDPPQYGRVIVAVDVLDASGVSQNNKDKYYTFLKDRCPIGIEPIIMSPEFMYLEINSTVYYNTKTTSRSEANVKALVQTAIEDFNTNNLEGFKKTLRFSKLTSAIDDANRHIISNDTSVMAILPIIPTLGTTSNYTIPFKNELEPDQELTTTTVLADYKPAVYSTSFTYNGYDAFLHDDGNGVIKILRSTASGYATLNSSAGTVDYTTGKVILSSFSVSAYTGSEIKIYGRTKNKDITSPKNRIMSIRSGDITITVNGIRE